MLNINGTHLEFKPTYEESIKVDDHLKFRVFQASTCKTLMVCHLLINKMSFANKVFFNEL